MNPDNLPVIISVETDKKVYAESDTIHFTVYAINPTQGYVELYARDQSIVDIWVLHQNSIVWTWYGGYCPPIWEYVLSPGEKLVVLNDLEWLQNFDDELSKKGSNKVPPGEYEVIGILDTDPQYISESIKITLK